MDNTFYLNGVQYDLSLLTVKELMSWTQVSICHGLDDLHTKSIHNLKESMQLRLLEKMKVPVPNGELFEQAKELYAQHKNYVHTVKFVREKAKIGLVEAKNWVDERRELLGIPPNPF